jgi:putative transposase
MMQATSHVPTAPGELLDPTSPTTPTETVRIIRLEPLRPRVRERLRQAQLEAAKVWTLCRDLHRQARQQGLLWPRRNELQQATDGGQFALHSQTVQMICHAFLANVKTTSELKAQDPKRYHKMRYPYKDKRYYPLSWPAQTVCLERDHQPARTQDGEGDSAHGSRKGSTSSQHRGRILLPMGRGRSPLIFPLDTTSLPEQVGGCQLVWKDGYELHLSVPCELSAGAEKSPGPVRAAVDLGEIHQAAVSTNTGQAILISGRGIRSLKRRQNMLLGQLARKRSRCEWGSRRWRKLRAARQQQSSRIERQVRDLRHKGTRKVIAFCQQQKVGTLYIGNPHGVRNRPTGRHHHQRMSQWEYGKDIRYLKEKAQRVGIMSFTGSERGTSSQCPACRRYQKPPKGREWVCRYPECGFVGHRDVVGSTNMHAIAYGQPISFPVQITYRRAGPVQGSRREKQPVAVGGSASEPVRRSRPDTGHPSQDGCCLGELADQLLGWSQRPARVEPYCQSPQVAHPPLGD